MFPLNIIGMVYTKIQGMLTLFLVLKLYKKKPSPDLQEFAIARPQIFIRTRSKMS
jgi:hypothetical protein